MTQFVQTPKKRPTTEEKLEQIHERMTKWNDFVRVLQVPTELAPAVNTGRLELLCLAKPRPMSEEEVKVLFNLIGGLLETNQVLQQHASLVADCAEQMHQSLRGALGAAQRMRDYANFRDAVGEDGDDEA